MPFRNGDMYPVYMKTCDVIFVFENVCDYYYMIGFISEESLSFGLLTVFEPAIENGDFWSSTSCILHV